MVAWLKPSWGCKVLRMQVTYVALLSWCVSTTCGARAMRPFMQRFMQRFMQS